MSRARSGTPRSKRGFAARAYPAYSVSTLRARLIYLPESEATALRPTAIVGIFAAMEIRPATPADLDRLTDIDATIDSTRYLHLHREGEGLTATFKLEDRPLREKLVDPNRPERRPALLAQAGGGRDRGRR